MASTPWIGELGRDGQPAISKNGNFIAYGKDGEIVVYSNRLAVIKNVTLSGARPYGNYQVLGISNDGERFMSGHGIVSSLEELVVFMK